MARRPAANLTRSIATLMCLTSVVAVALALCLSWARESYRQLGTSSCNGNLKYILLALRNYHDMYNCLPPAYVSDSLGRPAHSWRVLLLAADPATYDLYKKYNFNEAWDGPSNRRLADKMPSFYHCPNSTSGPSTDYFVVVGAGTAFPGAASTTLDDITRPRGSTVLVVEASRHFTHWMEPRDLDLEALSSGSYDESGAGAGSRDTGGAGLGLADGSVMRTGDLVGSMRLRTMVKVK